MTPPRKSKRPDPKPHRPVRHVYRPEEILRLRRLLRDAAGSELGGRVLAGPAFARLVALAWEVLPGRLDRRTLEDSLADLAGAELTPERLDAACWRLAGNLPRLRRRRPAGPWVVQRFNEWVPLQVLACRRGRGPANRLGATFDFRVMAGTPCPRIVRRFWSREQCRYYAPSFGFGRPRGHRPPRHPYAVPEQLVGLRLYGLVEPALSEHEPNFRVVGWPSSVKDWNAEIVRRRLRVDVGYACPRGYPDAFPCHKCPAGYAGVTRCPAATHRADWDRRPCPGCGRGDAFFDPDTPGELCVDCALKASYRHA